MNLVSVIIPAYNRGKYICQAIESVLNQTISDIELIVVDDGSSDDTRKKIKPYLKKINYIYTERGGPAHARNIGMKNSTGEYIAFLDSDDLYYPYKSALQADFLDKYQDIALVYTEFSAFDDNNSWNEFNLKDYHSSAYKNPEVTYENIFSENITIKHAGLNLEQWAERKVYMGSIFDQYYQNLIVFTPSVMFRREVLSTVGMQNERYWLCEDFEFVLRVTKYYRVAFIDAPTYKMRLHDDQISNTQKIDGPLIFIQKQMNLLEIAEKYGLYEKDYYFKDKAVVDKKLARLHRVAAIALMGTGKNSKIARMHLQKSASYLKPEYLLWLLTFTPHIFRRIAFKILSY